MVKKKILKILHGMFEKCLTPLMIMQAKFFKLVITNILDNRIHVKKMQVGICDALYMTNECKQAIRELSLVNGW
jgi:hypothetical protein